MLTCIKAVASIIPVPNCLMTVKTCEFIDLENRRAARTGPKTAIALVARMANRLPMRRGIL